MTIAIVVIVLIVVALAGAYIWYTNTPEYQAKKAKEQATQDALNSTGGGANPSGLKRGVDDAIQAAKRQRALGVNVDPGQDAIALVRNSYWDIQSKWNEERSTDVSDPIRRVNIMSNLAGMFEATAQLFANAIPAIATQAGLDDAMALYLLMMQDGIARRDCWWRRDTGCWRSWSVGEPPEDQRLSEEQARMRDFSRRILPLLVAAKRRIPGSHLFTAAELSQLHTALDGGDPAANPYDDETFNQITGALA